MNPHPLRIEFHSRTRHGNRQAWATVYDRHAGPIRFRLPDDATPRTARQALQGAYAGLCRTFETLDDYGATLLGKTRQRLRIEREYLRLCLALPGIDRVNFWRCKKSPG